MRAGGGYEEYEGSRKPVLYFGIHLLHTLARIIDWPMWIASGSRQMTRIENRLMLSLIEMKIKST